MKYKRQRLCHKFVKYSSADDTLRWQNDNDDDKLDEYAEFRIGSISKVITYILVLRAQDEGLLSVSDDVSLYVNLNGVADITIWHLMEHRSGAIRNVKGLKSKKYKSAADVYEQYRDADLFKLKLGEYSYSNVGYMLLSHILELVCGAPYADVLRLYMPDMQHTGIGETNIKIYDGESRALASDGRNEVYRALGAGGLYSCVHDLSHVFSALPEQMTKTGMVALKKAYFCKNGVIEHNGTIIGGRSRIMFNLDTAECIIQLMTNFSVE